MNVLLFYESQLAQFIIVCYILPTVKPKSILFKYVKKKSDFFPIKIWNQMSCKCNDVNSIVKHFYVPFTKEWQVTYG